MPKVTNWQEYLVAMLQETPRDKRADLVARIAKQYGPGFADMLRDMIEADELIRDNERSIG